MQSRIAPPTEQTTAATTAPTFLCGEDDADTTAAAVDDSSADGAADEIATDEVAGTVAVVKSVGAEEEMAEPGSPNPNLDKTIGGVSSPDACHRQSKRLLDGR